MGDLADVMAVVMAKQPRPGRVKTRLVGEGGFSAEDACGIAEAMLRCIVERLGAAGDLVVAVSPDGCGEWMRERLDLGDALVIDQGDGDLGDRLDRVWRAVAPDRPVAFFGMDSPDLPPESLRAIPAALERAEAAVGPTHDGGYWTLAARRHQGALLRDIDWGSPSVYDQTIQRATDANVRLQTLTVWPDVDSPGDVEALRRRLKLAECDVNDPRGRLGRRLDEICGRLPERDQRTEGHP